MVKAFKIILVLLTGFILFVYGYAVSRYQVFPHEQLQSARFHLQNLLSSGDEAPVAQDVETIDTLLHRLLIKKIFLNSDIHHGGGITNVDSTLYIVTNKGKVMPYNLERYTKSEAEIETVPMNYNELVRSGEMFRNDFKERYFRVHGVYAEQAGINTHHLYVSHQWFDADNDCIRFAISKLQLDPGAGEVSQASDWEQIFATDPCLDFLPEVYMTEFIPFLGNVSGGRMLHYDEEHLLVSVGDFDRHGVRDGIEIYAQDSTVPYGKFILLNKNTGAWRVYAKGIRNAQGLYRDADGEIWATDHGPKGGDELNIIEEGENYGWPLVSYGVWYHDQYHFSDDYIRGSHGDYREPVYTWTPSIATSNLTKIEGDRFDHWKGDLLISSLRSQSLHRVRLGDTKRVVNNERIELGHRIRDLTTLPNGSIALITDDGYLIIVDDGGPSYERMNSEAAQRLADLNRFDRFAGADTPDAMAMNGQAVFEQKCSFCHNMVTTNRFGPHLNNLFEREIGDVDDFSYSNTLTNRNDVWTTELFRSFLLNPDDQFQGNTMPAVSLTEAEVDSLIQYIHD